MPVPDPARVEIALEASAAATAGQEVTDPRSAARRAAAVIAAIRAHRPSALAPAEP